MKIGLKGGRGENLAERIYRQLKKDIFDFRLLPGDRFSENEIAERMGASRTPVREALFRLERETYVQVLQRSGWQVKPFDFDYFEELYDVRTVLECAAVRRLCDLQQPEILLEDLMRIWRVPPAERLRDVDTLSGLDERFHETLVEAAGNTEMARIHHDLTERLRIIRRLDFTKPPRVDATYDEHGRILDAIAHHRTEQALMMLKAHIETSRNEVRKITLHMLHEARAKGREPEAANNNFQ
ncbi:MAG TPA: GntR family transcriptional regulator [Alcanivorax sp.]|jgi:DNA-binding GntR family transcriptional regulator|nr:GntR family transcriptional regulator [Alcanivorax sp.]HAD62708.1 GntR family transcriptional regulator [Alcanivorax sp.]|tara:strand:- start:8184 stop:8906 length:723 start_codon:yes stop_codon:yes gene_type:complete